MKKLIVLFAVFISYSSYGQSINDITKIAFSSTTLRTGFTEEIILTKDSLFINSYTKSNPDSGNYISKGISVDKWETALLKVPNMKLSKIFELESPTNKRSTDGARYSQLTFTTWNNDEYYHMFDEENPHEKLVGLLLELKTMTIKK
ncbi:MAG: hypothetical protein JEZ09_16290 [Salinivirgaceae bacterium]|nr:hypothetical protein [Salinivirgaceae bacterium]